MYASLQSHRILFIVLALQQLLVYKSSQTIFKKDTMELISLLNAGNRRPVKVRLSVCCTCIICSTKGNQIPLYRLITIEMHLFRYLRMFEILRTFRSTSAKPTACSVTDPYRRPKTPTSASIQRMSPLLHCTYSRKWIIPCG